MKLWKQSTYKSGYEQFLDELKKEDPHLEEKQRAGRSIWWNERPIDLDQRKRDEQSRIKQAPYVYQPKP